MQAKQTSKLASPFFSKLPCLSVLPWLRRPDKGQTEGESRNLYCQEVAGFLPVPHTLPSLERRISTPRCQGTCPLFLEGLWLGRSQAAHTPPTLLPPSQDS